MHRLNWFPTHIILIALSPAWICASQAEDDRATVKIFILAGQSNMEGKAKNELMELQATDTQTEALFAHLRQDDRWIVRDDVFIQFLNRHGGLTIGYGSPGRTGVELEFGTQMGNHFEAPVLLIKTAWGGHSLFKQFRSPSAGLPDEKWLQQELKQARDDVKKNNQRRNRSDPLPTMTDIQEAYGRSYRKMISDVRDTLANGDAMFPALKGKRWELTGLVWFQGWNDMYGGAEQEYQTNMRHFIHDVRSELAEPDLPIVIGVMGQNGSQPAKAAMRTIQEAQLSMESLPEFVGNVKAVRTDILVDKTAEQLFPQWRENVERWETVGSDFPYHYLGSAIWFNRIGGKMAEAMLKLLGEDK